MKAAVWTTREPGTLFPLPKPTPANIAAAIEHDHQVLANDRLLERVERMA